MKIKQIFAVLPVSASLMSCNFLDEFDPNATTAGNFYTSEADIETSLNGVYQSLAQSYYYQYNYYFTDVRAHVTVVTDSGASSISSTTIRSPRRTSTSTTAIRSCSKAFRESIRCFPTSTT